MPMYNFVYFINTNLQSKMRISHLESFCLVLLSKKLVLFAESERTECVPPRYKLYNIGSD